MLAASDPTLLKIAASSKLIPVYGMHVAGGLLMGSIKDVEARPDRFIAAYSLHQDNALAILIKGPVNEPKYKAGGVATMNPGKAPEPGNMVFALASGELHFRRWMPKQHGTLAGSELVACNPAYPPIVMSAGDIILAVMGEYTTSSHD
jgi:SOS-response transcriptional repressor LexA